MIDLKIRIKGQSIEISSQLYDGDDESSNDEMQDAISLSCLVKRVFGKEKFLTSKQISILSRDVVAETEDLIRKLANDKNKTTLQ